MSTVAKFEITYNQFLDKEGCPQQALPGFANDAAFITRLYETMVLTRLFDDKAIKLQRTGKLGTYPSTLGQEAVSVGYGSAMTKEDVMVPYYRDYGAQFWRGIAMAEILRYWGGDERGSNFANSREDFPISVPIASQVLHGVGIAKAFQYRHQKRAVVTTIGDGGTSEGDFYEAVNLAGTWDLPIVFVIINNQWAISVPREAQTKTKTIAQKGIAGNVPGEQVDGNDIFAVYHATSKALEKAKTGGGPSIIEAITYRLCDHTTADDAKRYRSEQELNNAWDEEPIKRLRLYMEQQNMWSDEKEQTLLTNCKTNIEQAVSDYLTTPKASVADMFDYMYAELPKTLQQQKAYALALEGE